MIGEDRFPRLLICEGEKDKLFFHHFIEVRKLPRFHIRAAGGKDRIGLTIENYKIEPKSNFPSIGSILIVVDNDDDPQSRFDRVCEQINEVFPGTAADKPLKKSKKSPFCTVLMVPWENEHGTLEQLVHGAARAASGKSHSSAVDNFLATVQAYKWESKSRYAKAWLRSSLAVRCTDPFVPLGEVFRNHQDLIDLKHKSLDRIASILASYGKKSEDV
jgi:uncharacterized protein DUF3226